MTTTTVGPLSSDHVNYLILRYLQEAGHEASATAFYRDWRRPAEYRDPEDLPFAPSVQRHELVSVIQDGLYHDELLSRVRKEGRRFQFMTNGVQSESRPATAGKGKGRLDQMRRGTDDFPTPPPKRQRKSEEGPQERQFNGAAEPMEVDAASPSVGDAEEDPEAVSPAVQTPEPEILEVPERYDSMDVAVQTDPKTGPKTSTMYWQINRPEATILHSTFSPAKGSRALFTAGEGVSQFYDLPGDFESGVDKITSVDDTSTGPGSVVTACAWHPEGRALAFAVDSVREIGVGGKQERRQIVKSHDATTSRTTQYRSLPLLEPPGIVLALRYSWDGLQLLAVRTNGFRGIVEIWSAHSAEGDGLRHCANVIAWHIFDARIMDATWVSKSDFFICGDDGLLQKFRVASDQTNGVNGGEEHSSKTARSYGLEVLTPPSLPDNVRNLNFDKVRASLPGVDSAATRGALFVAVASEEHMLIQGLADEDEARVLQTSESGERATALAFRPDHERFRDPGTSPTESLLAVAREDGHFVICQVQRDGTSQVKAVRELVDGSPALALAWSPDGSHLAVSGVDVVQIWETLPLASADARDQNGRGPGLDPVVTWRRDKTTAAQGPRNGEHVANGDGGEPLLEPSLSWSADGENLALAVGKDIAVIRFRPPLHESTENAVNAVNDHIIQQ